MGRRETASPFPPREAKKTRSSLAVRLQKEQKFPRTLSKSALRRQKQRAKEQLAGNQEGMQALTEMVTSMEEAMEDSPSQASSHPRLPHVPSGTTAKSRRAMLTRERQRQPFILADLQKSDNPFAALRTHARNTLELAARPATGAAAETDETMG
ncbi:90S preribosome protein [Malassezia pachydermatis]|uniref:Ribosome biogenesis protein SLX9 n=1 Tax=Malassezia pachydermatis TaxID=77020 RepID=A0A0M8MI21_9BASI|nr:hypothetical protein Malapachy_0585 [Malassezia pachydermatis]KOS12886.1 hypothetical protein Malapachy_0585 [Malassezia pachydermatis]